MVGRESSKDESQDDHWGGEENEVCREKSVGRDIVPYAGRGIAAGG